MKTKQLLSVLFTGFIAASALAQTQGGPDAFGYIWRNNANAQGPAYVWNDIKATGTQITGLADDNSVGPFNLNWNFRYYWTNYNKITVGSNGWIGFTGAPNNIAATFSPLPSVLAKNTVDPMLCDLTFTKNPSGPVPGATAWYWTNNVDTLIVQYDSIPFWVNNATGYSGRNTFQVILSGTDSSVTIQYKLQQNGSPPYDLAGEGLYTGIVNSSGQIGLQVIGGAYPASTSAVKFYYPNPVTYQVFDATPAWNQNPENGGFFVSQNNAVNLTTDVANAGNQPISNIGVAGQLFDVSLSQVWSDNLSVASLAAGTDAMLTYPTPYNANTAGTFLYRTTSTLTGDMNSANDITDVEMVVVDTSQATISLAYSEATTPASANAWGGNGGQGIYIEPPFYPAAISSLDFMVAGSGANGYHLVQIVDNDGPGNSPGTVLYLDSVAASAAVVGVYNNVPVTTPVVIASAGVYVAWFENGDSVSAIGTDAALPLSNRNYEIIGGSWASYRNNGVDDIMIKANIYKFGNITTSATADGCPSTNTGSATVSISGGMTPFTYMWTPGGQTTATATGLAAGTYSVDVTDANGAMTTVTVFVPSNISVSVSSFTNITCYGANDGTATAAIGGTAPYTYMWTPGGQTTQIATGLAAGTHTVTATNADGCVNTATVTITSPLAIVINATTVPINCFNGCDGSTNAVVSGGTSPYTYMWSNGVTTQAATGLCAGTYSIVVTDAAGCTNVTSVVLTNPAVVSTSATSTPCTTCPATPNGTATGAAIGGTGPYTYVWSPGGQTTANITGLLPGTYTVCATDANGCSNCASVTVVDNTGVNELFSGASIVISPNPFNSSAQVKIDFVNPNHNKLNFVVFDIYGREIQAIDLSDRKGATTIDFKLNRGYNIPNGLYFYRLKDSEGILSSGKIIVQ